MIELYYSFLCLPVLYGAFIGAIAAVASIFNEEASKP